MSKTAIARRYAQALVDLCDERGDHDNVRASFDRVAGVLREVPESIAFMANPTVPESERVKLLDDLLKRTKTDGSVANFVRLLLERGRLHALLAVHARFSQMLDDRSGRIVAHVTSATPLAETRLAEIQTLLAGKQAREVELQHGVDETLIGGLVIRVGNTIYDGSVRNHLGRLRERMSAGTHAS